MRALVVGITGGIGSALAREFTKAGHDVLGTSLEGASGTLPLDLSGPDEAFEKLPAVDAGFLCAAMTKQADCRANPAQAQRVNVEAPIKIAQAIASAGGRPVFLSTNAVFDGTQAMRFADAPTAPKNFYGRQKAEAEKAILTLPGAAVVRMTKVLTPKMPLFVNWMEDLRRGRKVRAFKDLFMAPVMLEDVLSCLRRIAETKEGGIFQLSAPRDISFLEACRHIASRLNAPESLVEPASAAEQGIPVEERPRHTTMDSSRAESLLGKAFPDPLEALDQVFGLVGGPEASG